MLRGCNTVTNSSNNLKNSRVSCYGFLLRPKSSSSAAWKLVCEFTKLCTMAIDKGVLSALHTMHRHLYWRWLVSPSFYFLGGGFENRLLAKKIRGFSARVRLKSSPAKAIC